MSISYQNNPRELNNKPAFSGTKYGFIGTGNMGSALARALRKIVPASNIGLANRTLEKAKALADEIYCRAGDNQTVVEWADIIFLGVKPQMLEELFTELAPILAKRTQPFVLVSMAAGIRINRIQELAGRNYPVIRIMPNTPVSVGEGVILYACSSNVTPEIRTAFLQDLSQAGRFVALPESQIDAGSAISGCGPAFVDLFIEALADGGVACGLPRATTMELAAQMILGSAKLALESGSHPGVLKDAVCSPAGTTIQAVRKLESNGFRSAAIEAVIAAYERTIQMQ